tara:strand:- start:2745 stop:3326 length:582 start_codon:yes stop_codon:yes gene_type:complete
MSKEWFNENFEVMLSRETIESRTKELAEKISAEYSTEGVVAVGILRGCFMFFSELIKNMNCPTQVDFMYVSSYGDAATSSGVVKIEKDLQTNIAGRHVLLIDDIIDSGLTLHNLREMLMVRKPKSIKICTLLDKKVPRKIAVEADYKAFDVENYFVVGFGLDYKQFFRNMNFIGKLKDGRQDELDRLIESTTS